MRPCELVALLNLIKNVGKFQFAHTKRPSESKKYGEEKYNRRAVPLRNEKEQGREVKKKSMQVFTVETFHRHRTSPYFSASAF